MLRRHVSEKLLSENHIIPYGIVFIIFCCAPAQAARFLQRRTTTPAALSPNPIFRRINKISLEANEIDEK